MHTNDKDTQHYQDNDIQHYQTERLLEDNHENPRPNLNQ